MTDDKAARTDGLERCKGCSFGWWDRRGYPGIHYDNSEQIPEEFSLPLSSRPSSTGPVTFEKEE
jgi:hypothetical protein